MKLREAVRDSLVFLSQSGNAYKNLEKRTLEDVLEQYVKLLLLSGFLAAAVTFLFGMGRAIYLDLIRQVSVEYLRALNYTFSIGAGTFFFYLFIGTFGTGLASLLLSPFFRVKYTRLLQILCLALMPVLLFGWIAPTVALGLFLWSLYLFVLGVQS